MCSKQSQALYHCEKKVDCEILIKNCDSDVLQSHEITNTRKGRGEVEVEERVKRLWKMQILFLSTSGGASVLLRLET